MGVPVFAETCPHYLFFNESVYDSEDFDLARYVMSPPLRSRGRSWSNVAVPALLCIDEAGFTWRPLDTGTLCRRGGDGKGSSCTMTAELRRE